MRAKVESELYRPQEEGIIRPVAFSEWAAPIVPVLKASGDIRICDDYKVTINQAVKVDKHPSSRISHADCMSRLPLPDAPSHVPVQQEVVLVVILDTTAEEQESDATKKGQENSTEENRIGQEGERRKSYSAAVIDGIKRNTTIYVGDSIIRKTDTRLSKGRT